MINKKIKFIALTLISTVFIAGLSGCSTKKSESPSDKQQKIVIGMDDSFPPMEFRDSSNNLQGFDIDLANEISKRLNIKFEFMPTDWNGVIQSLNAKRFDIILSSLSVTPEREQQIAFSKPYLQGNQIVVVSKNNTDINVPEDLKGKIVGVQLGSTSEAAMKPLVGTIKEVKKYEKNTEALEDLAIGRTQAVVVDELVGRYYIKEHSDKYRVLSQSLAKEPIAIGFRKEDTALKDKFDKVLDEMQKDGTMESISKKWFGENITK